jgi:hypothetical protein
VTVPLILFINGGTRKKGRGYVARRMWADMGGARRRGSPLQSFKMSLAPLCEETVHTCTGNGSFTTGYPKDFLYRIKKLQRIFLIFLSFLSFILTFHAIYFSTFINVYICHKICCNINQLLI